jgi:hypothetical protein
MGGLSAILPTALVAVFRRWVAPARQRYPDLGFFCFPPEIVFMILPHLGARGRLSLALTCKTLHRLYFPTHAQRLLEPRELTEFLLGLERDVPNVVYCHHCSTLHPWTAPQLGASAEVGLRCYKGGFLWGAGGHHLSYLVARVVMNAHFYGSSHGSPAGMLNMASSWQVREVSVASSCEARIIDDHLIVSYTMRFSNDRGDAAQLRKGIDDYGPPICDHLTTNCNFSTIYCLRDLRLPELEASPQGPFKPCTMSVKSCPACLTDYCINVSSNNDKKGCVITLIKYHDAGKVRSPHDREWQLINSVGDDYESPRCMHKSTWPPGCVRQKWLQGSDTALEEEATWAVEDASLEKWINEGRLREPDTDDLLVD